ncbi:hypothetical protein [Leucobacter sp. GX0328]
MSASDVKAERCAAVYAREDLAMLVDMHEIFPHLNEYPISGDMLAVIRRGTRAQRRARRLRANRNTQ